MRKPLFNIIEPIHHDAVQEDDVAPFIASPQLMVDKMVNSLIFFKLIHKKCVEMNVPGS